MNKEKLFLYRDDCLYLHHTLTKEPIIDDFPFKSHSHNMVEIYYFLSGNARFVVEGNIFPLEKGCILVMASGQTHNLLLESSDVYERMAILIDTPAVPNEYDTIKEQVYNGANLYKLTKEEQIWFEESFSLIKNVSENMKRQLIYSFASMVFAMASTKLSPEAECNVEDDLVKKTIRYINENLSEKLSLETIAGVLYCSKVSLNRKFREIMGCTVWEYVVRRRIFNARQSMLLGKNITDAYLRSGFCDYSSFFRAYKKIIGISPSEDIKKLRS